MMRQRRGLPRGTPPPQRAPDPSRPELDPRTCCSGWLVSGRVHDASQPGRRGAGHGSAACMTRGQFNRASRHRPPYEGNALPLRHTGPTPNGQARRSTAQLRRPLFPITRADSGVQVTRTTRLARPGPRYLRPDARRHPCRPACPASQPLSPVRSFSTNSRPALRPGSHTTATGEPAAPSTPDEARALTVWRRAPRWGLKRVRWRCR
jgi:hypothetical protein